MRPKMILVATVLGGLLAASPAAQAHVLGYTFTEIYPPGAAPGTIVGSFSYGLNNLGQVVGGYQDSLGSLHGYIYTGGKYVTFDEPGAAGQTSLNGINDFGQIVGTGHSGAVGQGPANTFLYNHGKFTNIANSDDFSPLGLNDRGQILGFSPVSATGNYAVYTAGVFTPLPTVSGAAFIEYNGFNNIAQFVGVYLEGSSAASFVETKGVLHCHQRSRRRPGRLYNRLRHQRLGTDRRELL